MSSTVPSISPCALITVALALYPCSEICSCTNSSARSTFEVSSGSGLSGKPPDLGSKEPGLVDSVMWASCRSDLEDLTVTREALKPGVLVFCCLQRLPSGSHFKIFRRLRMKRRQTLCLCKLQVIAAVKFYYFSS